MSLLDGLFNFPAKKRKAAQGFPNQQAARKPKIQAFILEKMRTPSGIVDGLDDVPDPAMIEPPLSYFPDVDIPEASDGADGTVPDLGADGDFDSAPEAAGTESVLAVNESLESLVDNASEISTVEIDDVPFIENDDFAEDGLIGTVEPESASEVISESVTDGAAEVGITARESEDVPFAEGDEITKSEPVGEAERSEIPTDGELTEEELVVDAEEPTGEEPVAEAEELIEDDLTEEDETDDKTDEELTPTVIAGYTPFESGVFTVGESGEVKVDFLFDGGKHQGELAIVRLNGMENLEPGSKDFIQEATHRALSDSMDGTVIISDRTEGARFSGSLGDSQDWNSGVYFGSKTFLMNPGDRFAIMLVPNGTVQEVFDNPMIGGDKRPLFSMEMANPDDASHVGQLVDVFGDGTTFVMEDLRVDGWTDRDYNDLVFRIEGATGYTALMEDVIASGKDWRYSELGQEILSYVSTNDNPDKAIPGVPERYPDLRVPQIPQTDVDQGGNGFSSLSNPSRETVEPNHGGVLPNTPTSIAASPTQDVIDQVSSIDSEEAVEPNRGGALPNTPTLITASPTQDVIDQVSSIDSTDIYRVDTRQLTDTEFTVLSGETSVTLLTPSGEVLSTQVLTRGTHSLNVPDDTSGEILIKVDSQNSSTGTYVLEGFESKAQEPFNIDLEFGEGLTASQQSIIQAAAQSVESMIEQGLPSAILDGKIIDDINIKVSLENLDGASGTLAQTKIDFMRYGTLLPAQSLVRFDATDVAALESSGKLFSVVQHEILHALGFGNLWEAKGLVDYAKTPFSRYKGKNAVEAFQESGGATDYIPLETEGDGSADLHWNEMLFQDEVMTKDLGFQMGADGKATSPASTITLAVLADLGYQVNQNRATPNWGLLGGMPPLREEDIPQNVQREFERLKAQAEAQPRIDDPVMVPAVDPTTISPTIWANATQFSRAEGGNDEYYDWIPYRVQLGDNLSQIALDTMGSAHPDYYWWIARHNGIPNPDRIWEYDWIEIPRHRPNYAQEQEEERRRREEELRRIEEEQRRRREQLEEAYRQQGQGGLEWFLANPLPEFGSTDPYETSVRDLVGSLVPDDYFRFTLSRNGRVTIDLKDLLADADLYLYDSRNRLIATSALGGVSDERIIADLTAGTYLARVKSASGVTTDYDLKVKFQGKLSRTQMGRPYDAPIGSGGGTGGGSGGRRGSTFSDPRIERIYVTAVEEFAAPLRRTLADEVAALRADRDRIEREQKQLIEERSAQFRAGFNAKVDGIRNDMQNRIGSQADSIKGSIDGVANWALGAIDGLIPSGAYNIPGLGDALRNGVDNLRGTINGARNWLNAKVDEVRNAIQGFISWFADRVKEAYITGGEVNIKIEEFAKTIRGWIDEQVSKLNGWINDFKVKVLGPLEFTRNIRNPFNGWNLYDHVVVGLVDKIAGDARDAVNFAGGFFKDRVSDAEYLAQQAVGEVFALLGDDTGRIYNQMRADMQAIDNEINRKTGQVENTIRSKAVEYQSQIRSFLNGLGEASNFIIGSLMGEFNNEPSIWQTLLDTAIGMIPIVGEIGDVRDLIAFVAKFTNDPAEMQDFWNWVGVGGAGLGLIPVVGGALKGVTKLARNADLIQEIRKLAAPVVDAIIDFARKADWSALIKQTSDFFDKILGTVEGILIKLNESISNFRNLIPQLGLQLQPEIGKLPDEGFFADMADRVRELRRTAPKKIEEGFAFIKGKLDELAKETLDDLIKKSARISPARRQHILDGDGPGSGGHGPGRGISGKSEFPLRWSDNQTIDYIMDVVKDPSSRWKLQEPPRSPLDRWKVEGTKDGVDIRVIVEPDGEGIITAFPTNIPPNP
jgi:hypothetical protein